jgi:stearoyl-CoA desaturase (Delta-9 desaturase)
MEVTMSNFNRGPALFLIIYQSLLIISLPFYFAYSSPSLAMVLISILLLYITGISITGGYHRLYSHRAYKTNKFIELIVLFFSSMAAQGSALRWSFDHRLHHAHVDTDEDPYSISKGFWYAHCLWILKRPKPIDPKVVPDLIRNPLVQFQHRHYRLLLIATNAVAFLFIGWLLNDYVGAFFLSLWTRLFFLHHFTWFINSLAHTWGDKPFCQEQSAVNNYVIAFLTFGEGYHNFHHTFANDYRNGIRWYHFDPTKWIIWTLSKLGLASGLKTVDALTIKKRLVTERTILLSDRLRDLWYVKKDEVEQTIHELSERLLAKIAKLNELKERYQTMYWEGQERDLLKELKIEIKVLRKSLKNDWALWVDLSRNILKMKPLQI